MSSNNLIRSNSTTIPNYEQYCYMNTRTRSSSSASDDPNRKRMTHLTTRLKNAFRISHQPIPSSSSSSPSPSSHATNSVFPSSAPMKVRSLSLPSSHKQQQQNYYFPSADQLMSKSRPLSCVFEQSTDVGYIQEDATVTEHNDGIEQDITTDPDHAMELDLSSEIETPTPVPGLIIDDSACSSTVSEVDSLNSAPMTVDKYDEEEDDTFVYEQQTEWVNTEKHWFSDYKFPFQSKSSTSQDPPSPIIQRPPKQPHEGILKQPTTTTTSVLGKRPIPANTYPLPSVQNNNNNSSGGGPFSKKKKRIPVIRFDKMVQVHATYSQQDYNRQSDPDAICTRLNATLAHQIKQELNLYKTTEMSIHEQSKVYTQLFC